MALVLLVAGACVAPDPIDTAEPDSQAPPDSDTPDTSTDTEAPVEHILSDLVATLDPYDRAPLTAVLTVAHEALDPATVEAVTLTLSGDGDDLAVTLDPQAEGWTRLLDQELVEEGRFGLPVIGLFAGSETTVELVLETPDATFSGSLAITTDELPDQGGQGRSLTVSQAEGEPGWPWFDGFAYDTTGALRWKGPAITQQLDDGAILTGFDEVDWLGRTLLDRVLPEGMRWHHDAIQLPGGTVLGCVDDEASRVVTREGELERASQDQLVELAADGSEVVNVWDLRAFLDVDRATLRDKGGDWVHVNTLVYDEHADAVVISARYQGLVSLSRGGEAGDEPNAGKELRWIFAPHMGWGRSGWDGQGELETADHLLTAVDSTGQPFGEGVQQNLEAPGDDEEAFFWPLAQHGLRITHRQDGLLRLLTFSNQASMLFDGPDSIGNATGWTSHGDLSNDRTGGPYSVLAEYEIDEEALTVRMVAAFGADQPELYGSMEGGVSLGRETGNPFLVTPGYDQADPAESYSPVVVEVDAAGEEVSRFTVDSTAYTAMKGGRLLPYAEVRR